MHHQWRTLYNAQQPIESDRHTLVHTSIQGKPAILSSSRNQHSGSQQMYSWLKYSKRLQIRSLIGLELVPLQWKRCLGDCWAQFHWPLNRLQCKLHFHKTSSSQYSQQQLTARGVALVCLLRMGVFKCAACVTAMGLILTQASELAEFTAKISLLEEAKRKKDDEATEWQHKVHVSTPTVLLWLTLASLCNEKKKIKVCL